jgi:choline kinase
MKAIILAAGRGSRMKNLTANIPKCLVKVQERPLLEWQINAIHTAGISEIAIVTGYRKELLRKYNLVEFYNPRWAETNMVSSLAYAKSWLKEDNCIVSYSDIFYNTIAVEDLIKCIAPIAISYDPNWLELWKKRFEDPLIDAESFLIDKDNYVIEIGKKPDTLDEIQGQFMGLLRLSPGGWSEINRIRSNLTSKHRDIIQMTHILQQVIEAKRHSILGIPYKLEWGEVDSESDLIKY